MVELISGWKGADPVLASMRPAVNPTTLDHIL
jgi:hypothetical protein